MSSNTKIDMRDAFFEPLVEMALDDERAIILSADHAAFSLQRFQKNVP